MCHKTFFAMNLRIMLPLLLPFLSISSSLALIRGGQPSRSLRERVMNHRKLRLIEKEKGGIDDQYIVTFEAGVDAKSLLDELMDTDANGSCPSFKNSVLFPLTASAPGAVMKVLQFDDLICLLDNPNVWSVEQDQKIEPNAVQSNAQWNLDKIDNPSADLDGNYHYDFTGKGVDVYVIDTGIKIDIADFGGRASCGFNAFDEDGCEDIRNHGTHVGSIIGGTTYGVAKDVHLIAVKCDAALDGTGGSMGRVINGINYVIDQKKAKPNTPAVANISLGGGFSQALNNAVDRAVEAGVVMVTSAGNGNTDACTQSPQSASKVISVGAISQNNARSSFSNYGACVDIFAPGQAFQAASPLPSGVSNMVGTSFASPQVAGAAAMYLENEPNKNAEEVGNQMKSDAAAGLVVNQGAASPNLVLSIQNLNSLDGKSGGSDGTDTPTPGPTPDLTPGPTPYPTPGINGGTDGRSDGGSNNNGSDGGSNNGSSGGSNNGSNGGSNSSVGSSSSCFSASTVVQVQNKGPMRMDALEIGDSVLTGDGSYSMVYSFAHYEPKSAHPYKYIQIESTGSSEPIELSGDHMLYKYDVKAQEAVLVRAEDVLVGDLLVTLQHSSRSTSLVTATHKVTRSNAFAPFTATGDIVVNNIVASNYVAFPQAFQPILSLDQQKWIQHSIFKPYHFYCGKGGCKDETYNEKTGMPTIVGFWLPLLWVLEWVLLNSTSIVTAAILYCYLARKTSSATASKL